VSVGLASPERGEKAGEERSNTDQDARPLGRIRGIVNTQFLDKKGEERKGETEAQESRKCHERRDIRVPPGPL
jgi:hypothetical protein